MSQLLGDADPQRRIWANNTDLHPQWWRVDVEIEQLEYGYTTPWWPGAGWVDGSGGGAGDMDLHPIGGVWWERVEIPSGSRYRFIFAGVTRDVYGSPLGNVTVKCYRTSTDEMVGQTISDPLGNYLVTTPYYPDAHYLVCYKTGSPDVQGTSTNTLVPT